MKYGWIEGEGRFFFLMSIIDVFDRAIVAYHHSLSCEAKDLVQITQDALMKRQLFDKTNRPVIRSDNGPQFISHRFAEACEQFQLVHERIPPKTPNKNAHIESFHAILESECYQRHEFESYQQAYEIVSRFIHNYNYSRLHGSLYDCRLLNIELPFKKEPWSQRSSKSNLDARMRKSKQDQAILCNVSNKRCLVRNKGVKPV